MQLDGSGEKVPDIKIDVSGWMMDALAWLSPENARPLTQTPEYERIVAWIKDGPS